MKKSDQISPMKVLGDHMFRVGGWALTVYTENGSHFTGSMITQMSNDHAVIHFTSTISHP